MVNVHMWTESVKLGEHSENQAEVLKRLTAATCHHLNQLIKYLYIYFFFFIIFHNVYNIPPTVIRR